MEPYIKTLELRWSDLDPNFHLRHSAYYDFGAYARICYLEEHGLSTGLMQQLKFGPILFREECVFRKEIRLGDNLGITVQMAKAKPDFSRWTIQHQFMKNGQPAALLTVDGAWMNTELRKLAALPDEARPVFEGMPRAENFEWIVK